MIIIHPPSTAYSTTIDAATTMVTFIYPLPSETGRNTTTTTTITTTTTTTTHPTTILPTTSATPLTTTTTTTTAEQTTIPSRTTTTIPIHTTTPVLPTTLSMPPITTTPSSTTLIASMTTFSSTISASIPGASPTAVASDTDTGLPKVAVVGISVAGVAIASFIIVLLVLKNKGVRKHHKALEQDDIFDHLPIQSPSPAPLTSTSGYHQPYHHDGAHHYRDDMGDKGGAHHHELEPMYHNHHQMHHMGHHDGDGHHGHPYHQGPGQGQAHQGGQGQNHGLSSQGQAQQGGQGQSQGLSNQGQAHQGGQGQSQGVSNQGQAQHSQPGHQGVADQGGAHQSGSGHGLQDPNAQGISNQGPGHHGSHQQPLPPGSHGAPYQPATPGNQGIPQPGTPGNGFGGGPPLTPLAPPLINRPRINTHSQFGTSTQYMMLQPSPTNTSLSMDLGLIDETSIPARGSLIVGPLPIERGPLSASLSYQSSSGGVSARSRWDDYTQQEFGYSAQNNRTLQDQAHYHDASSFLHASSRVLPLPPTIATIPTIQSSEVRAPQDRNSEAVGAIASTGNVSSLNTFDRRHPQTQDGLEGRDSLFDALPHTLRDPQDN